MSTEPRRQQPPNAAEPRREQLLNAADRVVQREGPGASMNAIAAEAGITKPILYRHFGDRTGLIRALTERHTSGLLAAVRAALNEPLERRDRVEHVLDVYLAGIESRPQVYRLLTHPESGDPAGAGQALAPALRQIAEEITKAVREQVDLGPDAPLLAETWGRSITGMVLAAGDWWLDQRPCPRARMVQALADLLWGRLAAAAPLPGAPA
ncbi:MULTISPECIES: TetR family transcriptional regulator [unclassified Kitasatospora]|uniref:TetR family transcriptional regulator n=1 Tax=unclassified Kitasatospora TaxID=2633591 RepID=UPI000710479C|nr:MULTISPECIES: TetR family transcriptional regulator [unclassified Kitasatospora]KQV20605.1 TetR family transcriptional regulator [Kitasatospora sp. Root107]KRB69065.1 TetR family transcriptional regulator [Kitasatospora sp. Root187]